MASGQATELREFEWAELRERAKRFASQVGRTVIDAVLRPRVLIRRWQAEPERYGSPLALLGVVAAIVSMSIYVGKQFFHAPGFEALEKSRYGDLALDAFSYFVPIWTVWGTIITCRLAARIWRKGGLGWKPALLVSGANAALTLASLPISLCASCTTFSGLTVAALIVECSYVTLYVSEAYEVRKRRALGIVITQLVICGVVLGPLVGLIISFNGIPLSGK